jgi:hypothetical protein
MFRRDVLPTARMTARHMTGGRRFYSALAARSAAGLWRISISTLPPCTFPYMPAKISCEAQTAHGKCLQNLYDANGDMAALLNIAEFRGWQQVNGTWVCPEHKSARS